LLHPAQLLLLPRGEPRLLPFGARRFLLRAGDAKFSRPFVGAAKNQLLTGSQRTVGHSSALFVRSLNRSQLTQRGVFSYAGNLGKAAVQRAIAAWRASVFERTLTLGLIREDHLAHSFTAADRCVDKAHDVSPFVYFSVVKVREIALL
jgi:hypothetical protein